MPNWQPNWNNVRWNHAAADAAVRALRRAADKLDHANDDRLHVARHAVADWLGLHRLTFDDFLHTTLSEAGNLAQPYRDAAARISAASDQARREQQHRERERREQERREQERQQRRHLS